MMIAVALNTIVEGLRFYSNRLTGPTAVVAEPLNQWSTSLPGDLLCTRFGSGQSRSRTRRSESTRSAVSFTVCFRLQSLQSRRRGKAHTGI